MVLIKKGQEPLALKNAKFHGLKYYEDMTTEVKNAIRKQLLKEQGYLCAYCMCRIRSETMQIEHYIAQNPQDNSYNPSFTIAYTNLLGVCDGDKKSAGHYQNLTCDQHRGNLPLTVDPLNAVTINKIKYRPDGTIYSDDKDIQDDLDVVLNLNCKAAFLQKNRKAALDSLKKTLFKKLNGKELTKKQLQHFIDGFQAKEQGAFVPYVGILLWYLEKRKSGM